MSQTDMDSMMYKIEGEDLYLIGTSEHSMIGRFIDQILPAESLPQTLKMCIRDRDRKQWTFRPVASATMWPVVLVA